MRFHPLPPPFGRAATLAFYAGLARLAGRKAPQDAARIAQVPEHASAWRTLRPGRGKGDDIHLAPWYWYLRGEAPEYPRQILEVQWAEVVRRLDLMANDNTDPETWDVHHWQQINPVCTEALLQLTCGGPQIVYHGGLLHVRLRYFDAEARRPGLPPDVGALVHVLDADSVTVTLVNLNPWRERRPILQAGAFGEHEFTEATEVVLEGAGAAPAAPTPVRSPHLAVRLPPGRGITLRLGMRRYVRPPSYAQPV